MRRKIALGILGEKLIDASLRTLFKRSNGFFVQHVDWQNYSYGRGIDHKVKKDGEEFLQLETKNWTYFDRPYSTKICEKEILSRFNGPKAPFSILIITFLSLLPQAFRTILKNAGIKIVEIGEQVTKNNFKYLIGKVVRKISAVVFGVCDSVLDYYTNKTVNRTTLTTTSNNTQTHDTNLRQLIFNLIRQAKQAKQDAWDTYIWTGIKPQ